MISFTSLWQLYKGLWTWIVCLAEKTVSSLVYSFITKGIRLQVLCHFVIIPVLERTLETFSFPDLEAVRRILNFRYKLLCYVLLMRSASLDTQAASSCKALVPVCYHCTWRHISEDSNLDIPCGAIASLIYYMARLLIIRASSFWTFGKCSENGKYNIVSEIEARLPDRQ